MLSMGDLRFTLTNPRSPTAEAQFGYSVSIADWNPGGSADVNIAVGARRDSADAADVGAAYLFGASSGNLRYTFHNPTPTSNDNFGNSVSTNGSFTVVGAIYDDTAANDNGEVSVFDAWGTPYSSPMYGPSPAASESFGYSVANNGWKIAVGTPYDNTGGLFSGRAWILDAGNGSVLKTLANPTPADGENFGASIAYSGLRVVVGAPYDVRAATVLGAAYVFDASNGSVLKTLTEPVATPGSRFGSSVAVSGTTVVVGAPTGASNAGTAYIFDAATGSLLFTLANPTPASDDQFGSSVAIAGDKVIIGAPRDDTDATDAGSAYVFDATTGNLLDTLANPTPANGDNFGLSVSVAGNTAVVGAPYDSTRGSNAGAVYAFDVTRDTTPPTVTINQAGTQADPTNGSTIHFTVTFDESVTDFATGDVTLGGTAGATTAIVTGSGTTYDVAVSGMTANSGTVIASLAAGVAHDVTGNASTDSTSTDNTVTYDNTAPTITLGAASAAFAAGGPITYTVTYADANFNISTLAIGNVTLNKTGTANATVGVSGTGLTRTVTLGGITGDGTLGISVAAGTASDRAGNTAPAAGPSATFIVDNTSPTITLGAPSAAYAAGGPVTYTVTYSDPNFNTSTLAAGYITLNKTGTANATVGISGAGLTRTVTISGVTGDGTLGISVAAGTASDRAGNTAPAAGPSATFIVDNTSPTITLGAPSAAYAAGGPVTYNVSYADATFNTSTLSTGYITLNKTGTANATLGVSGTGSTRTVTLSGITGNGILGISVAVGTASDRAGNTAPAAGPSATFIVDNTPPSVIVGGPSAPLTSDGPVTYTVTYSDANFDASTLGIAHITLNRTGTATGNVSVAGTGLIRTVTIDDITGDGALGISLAPGTASDLAGNLALAAGPSSIFVVDHTLPTVRLNQALGQADPTNAKTILFTAIFSEAVDGFGDADVIVSGTAGATTAVVTGSGTEYNVAVNDVIGSGTVIVNIAAGAAHDAVGFTNSASTSDDNTVTYDDIAPTVNLSLPAFMSSNTPIVTATANDNNPLPSGTMATLDVDLNNDGNFTDPREAGYATAVLVGGSAAFNVMPPLPDGMYGFRARLSDLSGNAGSSEVATTVVDTTKPTADLRDPAPGGIIAQGTINAHGYLDLTFTDAGSALNLDTIMDGQQEIGLDGAAASGVLVSPDPEQIGDIFRYHFTGTFGAGPVAVKFIADSLTDTAGNAIVSATKSFTVQPVWLADDAGTCFSTTGVWTTHSDQGFQDDYSDNTKGTGKDTASWSFAVTPGRYRVAVTWPGLVAGTASNAPFAVYDGTKLRGTVAVNERVVPADFSDQGGSWKRLASASNGGVFLVAGNTLVVKLTDKANGSVVADAVRIERLHDVQILNAKTEIADGGTLDFGTTWPGTPVLKTVTIKNLGQSTLTLAALDPKSLPAGFELVSNLGSTNLSKGGTTSFSVRMTAATSGACHGILALASSDKSGPFNLVLDGQVSTVHVADDGDAACKTAGAWKSHFGQGLQNDYRDSAKGKGKDTASWTFSAPAGQYRIAVTWPGAVAGTASNAPFSIYDGKKLLVTFLVDQRTAPSGFSDQGVAWNWLSVPGGGNFSVFSKTLVVKLTDKADGTVIADAVRIERVSSTSTSATPAGPRPELLAAALARLQLKTNPSWLDATQSTRRADQQAVDAIFASTAEDSK